MKKDMTLSEAMKKLEAIVATLEDGEQELESALKLYEEATKLSAYCSKKITETEQKITLLSKENEDG